MSDEDRVRREIARSLHVPVRLMGSFPRPTDGQLLYETFCGSRTTDDARYYSMMNPAIKERWEKLAADVRENVGEEGWRVIVSRAEADHG